jgi:hypothetical protein
VHLVEEFGKEKTHDCNSLFHNLLFEHEILKKHDMLNKITKKLNLLQEMKKKL